MTFVRNRSPIVLILAGLALVYVAGTSLYAIGSHRPTTVSSLSN